MITMSEWYQEISLLTALQTIFLSERKILENICALSQKMKNYSVQMTMSMNSFDWIACLIFIACNRSYSILVISFNQPTFAPLAEWSSNATTFAYSGTIGPSPQAIFVHKNGNIYLAEKNQSRVLMWLNGSIVPSRNISSGLNSPQGLFVTDNGDVYIDNGLSKRYVEKWTPNATSGVTVMNVTDSCYGLFIDTNKTLYCSMGNRHQVLKVSISGGSKTPTIAAGNTTSGGGPIMLSNPHGVFVDLSLNLYVADRSNQRIQMFPSGQLIGSTVAGNSVPGTIALNQPIGIILDVDGYLFIVEYESSRIVRSGPFGYRCIVGCSSTGNSASQLHYPYSFGFDANGNIFVSDQGNQRIQKFLLATNTSGK